MNLLFDVTCIHLSERVLFHDHVKNNSILHIKFVVTHCECRTKQNTSTIFCLLIANHVEYDGFIIKVFNDSLVKYFSSWPVLFVFFFCFSILQFICCPRGCKMENFTLTPDTSVNFFIYRNRRVCSQFVSKNIYTLLICLEMIINLYFIESGNLR